MHCNTTGFWGSDGLYVNSLHVLTSIEFPLHTFGAFIIIARTPKKMENVKSSMITLHLVGAFIDIYMSLIASPVLTLPMCAGYPLGLSLMLGIPTSVQVYLGICFVALLSTTVFAFFEDRYFRLVNGNTFSKKSSWIRKIYIGGHYVFAFAFLLPGYFAIPEQTAGKTATLKKIPCLLTDILDRPGFFVLAIDSTIPVLCIIFQVCEIVPQQMFFAFSITRFLSRTKSMSQATNKMQKQFFIALCIQVSVPVCVIILPVSYIVFSIWFDYFNQFATNLSMFSISTHGILSTLTMLSVHRQYREETLKFFNLKKKVTASFSTDPSQQWRSRSVVF